MRLGDCGRRNFNWERMLVEWETTSGAWMHQQELRWRRSIQRRVTKMIGTGVSKESRPLKTCSSKRSTVNFSIGKARLAPSICARDQLLVVVSLYWDILRYSLVHVHERVFASFGGDFCLKRVPDATSAPLNLTSCL
jgi:hypothetical protein